MRSTAVARAALRVSPGLRSAGHAGLVRPTRPLRTISDEYIPRNFPVKATTGFAGLSVEPLWKPKLLAAAAELQAFLKSSDIPPDSTYYNVTMTLVKRIYASVDECGDDWMTIEKKYFWGWPIEYILQVTWREVDTAQRWNEWRFWELDPEQIRKVAREDQGVGKPGVGYQTPWDQVVREDYDKRKKALSQEEMAELKRMDTEKMARETTAYRERKEKIKDDMERARGDMLKKFLNKRMVVEPELKRMMPGKLWSQKTSDDLIHQLKSGASSGEKDAKPKLPEPAKK